MAGIMHSTRPWLNASLRQPVAFATSSTRLFSTTQPSWRSDQSRMNLASVRHAPSMLVPSTLVAPPLSRFPKDNFLPFLWLVIKNRLAAMGSSIGLKVMSQPRLIFSKPLLNLGRSSVVPAAKALHVTLSEAVAAGDLGTIRSIASPAFAEKLTTQIQSRPRAVRAEWHLVSYNETTRYPRLADFRAVTMPIPGSTKNNIVKQAVVSIASTQEVVQYDRNKNREVPGSRKQKTLVEHLVLQSKVDMNTWKSEPWKVWGTIKESTYEQYLEDEQVLLSMMEKQQQQQQQQQQ